jgi:hypothetical protein
MLMPLPIALFLTIITSSGFSIALLRHDWMGVFMTGAGLIAAAIAVMEYRK